MSSIVTDDVPKSSRSRNFAFTYNNYPSTELVDGIRCRYMIYGKEVSSTGTPHLQGTVCFHQTKSFRQVIEMLPGCHISLVRNLPASIEYCKKEGNFVERGVRPYTPREKGEKEKIKWEEIFRHAEDGDFDLIPESIRIRYRWNLKGVRDDYIAAQGLQSDDVLIHEWYWGETGTGKTKKAYDENPGAYRKTGNKWWDHYQGEEVVIIDDFDKRAGEKLLWHLKIWGDHYPFMAEYKGGSRLIRPKKIIITSNWHPSSIWSSDEDLLPIMRRFKVTKFGRIQVPEKDVGKSVDGRIGNFHSNFNPENQ